MTTETRQTRLVQVSEPVESIWTLLRERVINGATAEEATDAVLAPYGELRLVEVARPTVLRAAQTELRNHTRKVERKVFAPIPGQDSEYRAEIGRQLARLTFSVDGVTVPWEEATLAQHKARVMYLETHIVSVQQTCRQHTCAVELIEEYGVERLRDIPDWQNLMARRISAQIGQDAGDAFTAAVSNA